MNNPSVGYGFSNNSNSPDYNDLSDLSKSQVATNSKMKQGSPTNPGVILTQDSLEVALEVAFGINIDRASPGRPSLAPLFRTRYAEENETGDLTLSYYQQQIGALPAELQARLNLDKQKDLEDRDPDLVALDQSLKFNAQLLALRDSLSLLESKNSTLGGAGQYLGLPDSVQRELLQTGVIITNFLDEYLANIGPNDPDYERLLSTSNLIKEAMGLFQLKDGSVTD
jgi:hypothetical protein